MLHLRSSAFIAHGPLCEAQIKLPIKLTDSLGREGKIMYGNVIDNYISANCVHVKTQLTGFYEANGQKAVEREIKCFVRCSDKIAVCWPPLVQFFFH